MSREKLAKNSQNIRFVREEEKYEINLLRLVMFMTVHEASHSKLVGWTISQTVS